MNFLEFTDVSFRRNANSGHLCEELNNVLENGIWYDTSEIRNTMWLWLVNGVFAAINNDKHSLGLLEYPRVLWLES
jgi:hypothetical protein